MWPLSSSGTLEPHLSALLWMAMLVSLAIVIVLPQPHGIRALIASTILRLIFSVGLEPTLLLLGGFNVSASAGREPVRPAASRCAALLSRCLTWIFPGTGSTHMQNQTLTKHWTYLYRTNVYTLQCPPPICFPFLKWHWQGFNDRCVLPRVTIGLSDLTLEEAS